MGVYIGAGSRADNAQNSGAANLVQRIATQVGGYIDIDTRYHH